jgi:RND family efflux transporter MFP subunit
MNTSRLLQSLCLAATMSLYGCSDPEIETEQTTTRVKVLEMNKQAQGSERRLSGKLVAAEQSEMSFAVGGTVKEVNVSPGETVSVGQILARLDSRPYDLAVQQARAQLNIARAEQNEKSKKYARLQDLVAKQLVSRAEFEIAEAELGAARGSLLAAQSSLDSALRDQGNIALKAPFDGQIVSRDIDPFQEARAGTVVFALQSEGALEVQVLVPETMIRLVDYGQVVSLTFPTYEGLALSGFVSEIGSQVIAGNAFPVQLQLNKGTHDLRPGMSVSAAFNFSPVDPATPVFLIPISALALDAGLVEKTKAAMTRAQAKDEAVPVFVFDSQTSSLALRSVKIKELRGNEFEVFEGLAEGDLVVTAGVSFLRDGQKVEIWDVDSGFIN